MRRLNRQPEARLAAVGRRVVLVETDDGGVAEEAATGDDTASTEAKRRRIRICTTQDVSQGDGCDVRPAGESKETRGCIQGIALEAGIRSRVPAPEGHRAGEDRLVGTAG